MSCGRNQRRGTDIHKSPRRFSGACGRGRFFCLLGFTRSTRPRNLKSFSIILTRCTSTPNYLSGEESRNWKRSRASHQRKQDWDKCMVAHGGRTFLALWLPERKQYVRGVIVVVPVAKNLQIHQTQSDLTKKTQRHFRPLHVAVNLTKNEHRI